MLNDSKMCEGTGKILSAPPSHYEDICPKCNGTGIIKGYRIVNFITRRYQRKP